LTRGGHRFSAENATRSKPRSLCDSIEAESDLGRWERYRLINLVHYFITKNVNLRVSLRNFPDDSSSGKRDTDIRGFHVGYAYPVGTCQFAQTVRLPGNSRQSTLRDFRRRHAYDDLSVSPGQPAESTARSTRFTPSTASR
jgi:hypothetical protein